MNKLVADPALVRAEALKSRLRRHKLVFVQCGAAFEPLVDLLLEHLGGTRMTAREFASAPGNLEVVPPLILTETEAFARRGHADDVSLGALRRRIDIGLEDANICLFSRAPRMAYAIVPGSSLIDDAAPHYLGLLDEAEIPEHLQARPGACLPAVGLAGGDLADVYRASLRELGVSCLADLDRAIYASGSPAAFMEFLDPRASEALRGAGLVALDGTEIRFAARNRTVEFAEALATVLAEVVDPPEELSSIAGGLWKIERIIRLRLRETAMATFGTRWRKQTLHGDLPAKVLGRARDDGHVTATSVSQLRDPIEWLSLGELLEVLRSDRFDGLGVDRMTWERFERDILPIRNRYSHMRLMHRGDPEIVSMWMRRVSEVLQGQSKV